MSDDYSQLIQRVRDMGRLGSIGALLDWDQATYMPPKGVAARAEQLALVAGLSHEMLVADETRALLDRASAPADDYVAQTNIRETRRSFERAVKVPTELVKDIARTSSLAKDDWEKAREAADFARFSGVLGKLVELKRREADLVGFEDEPYDALMDEFEPGAKSKDIEELFSHLGEATAALLRRITAAERKPDASILERDFPPSTQEILCEKLAASLNFDAKAGRSDVSVHPFCTTIGGSGDVRVTTRYQERFLPSAMFGTMHEVGHALYEQGLPAEHIYTPMAEAVSLGIHESQSRLWENMVGRSRPFWECHYEGVRSMFPESLGDVTLDQFYGAINTVTPSLIRVEADELTYNLHIVVRFQIERKLISGSLNVQDVPEAWNETMTRLVGVTPPNDADGCLQDIHWSMGAFGYFPTYALGNLFAAQFFAQASQDIPDLPGHIRRDEHRPLLDWLRKNIHVHGQRYRAHELVEKVTGQPLSIEPFMNYVTEKFSAVYGI